MSIALQASRVFKLGYIARQLLAARMAGRRGLRIAASTAPVDWVPEIRRYTSRAGHHVDFLELQSADLGSYDAVIPLTVEDSLFLADRPDLTRSTLFRPPSREVTELCDDKPALEAFLVRSGYAHLVPVPILDQAGRPIIPFFLKPRAGNYGDGCRVVRSIAEADAAQRLLEDGTHFAQRLLRGRREYAVHMLMQNGQLRFHLGVRYDFGIVDAVKGKDAPLCTWLFRCPHIETWVEILRRMGYEGICCVNYKYAEADRSATPMLLEINPRVGGSLALYLFAALGRLTPAAAGVSAPRARSEPQSQARE
jgi:hypothetical protein